MIRISTSPTTSFQEESNKLNESEAELKGKLTGMKEDIESSDSEFSDSDDIEIENGNIAGKLRKDSVKRCIGEFEITIKIGQYQYNTKYTS